MLASSGSDVKMSTAGREKRQKPLVSRGFWQPKGHRLEPGILHFLLSLSLKLSEHSPRIGRQQNAIQNQQVGCLRHLGHVGVQRFESSSNSQANCVTIAVEGGYRTKVHPWRPVSCIFDFRVRCCSNRFSNTHLSFPRGSPHD